MIIRRVEARNMPVPLAEVFSSFQKHLVVFPHPHDGRCFLNHMGCLFHRVQSDLVKPGVGGIIPSLLVKPVPVQNRKMDFIPDLLVQGVKDGDSGPGTVSATILIIATGKFEFEIKQPVGVALGIPEISCLGKGAEGTA